jgi:hypothetical protein
MINTLLIIVAILFGLYEIGYGFYACHLNGFKFYAVAGIVIGVPFLLVGLILMVHADRSLGGWEFLIALLWAFGVGWKAWRKRIARKTHPADWEKWEQILHGR